MEVIQGKSRRAIKYIMILVAVSAVISPVAIFTLYSMNSGSISGSANDWSAFGALLGGSFTLLGAAATTGTLLLLIYQQQDNRLLAERQLNALILDQYINHRRVFIERLEALEWHFGNGLKFRARDELYGRVFASNKPTNVEYVINVNCSDFKESGLQSNLLKYGRLADELESIVSGKSADYLLLIDMLKDLQDSLGMSFVDKSSQYGDVIFNGVNIGLNIFDFSEGFKRVEYILNSYLFYSGNDTVRRLREGPQASFWLRLYQDITELSRDDLYVHLDESSLITLLLGAYISSGGIKGSEGELVFQAVNNRLSSVFKSVKSVTDSIDAPHALSQIIDSLDHHYNLAQSRQITDMTDQAYESANRLGIYLRKLDRLVNKGSGKLR
ncbi:hypothetical protein [Pseudomonas putida]|uniref:hypothetical protein n=1 Tax=Pseudomonas putida TaxID=303 RepID=UPI00235CC9F9|nr:hypothetical protein [Pseudomonas putida]GLO25452.1 hypothetical protein PPUJ21368_32810 [Pseudomonas putida]HDS0968593.1 hypothetical protein [Pseudomonas putida]